MTNERTRIIGVAIEGIPGEDTSQTDGVCWYFDGGLDAPDEGVSDYDWTPGLVEVPLASRDEVNQLTGDFRASSLSMRFSASDAIAATLLRVQSRGASVLDSDITAAATSLTLSPDPSLSTGDVIYVGAETVRVTGVSGGGTYSVSRGEYRSTARAHSAGEICTTDAPPFWVPRKVYLVSALANGFDEIRWRGYLDSPPRMYGPHIELEATNLYARLSEVQLNTEPRNHNANLAATATRSRIDVVSDTPSTRGAGEQVLTGLAVQAGGAIFSEQATYQSGTNFARVDVRCIRGDERLGSSLDTGEPPEGEEGRWRYTRPIWELLVWDRRGDADSSVPGTVTPLTGDDAHHPVRIAQELIAGGELPEHWTLGADIDTTSFSDAIDDTPGLKVDFLVIGWDGEPFYPLQLANRILRAYGFQPSISEDGLLGVSRFEVLDVGRLDDLVEISPITSPSEPPDWRGSWAGGAVEVELQLDGLPFREPARGVVRGAGGTERARLMGRNEKQAYDIPTAHPDSLAQALVAATSVARLTYYQLPILRLRVPDSTETGASYDLGEIVGLEDFGQLQTPWFQDDAGTRLDSTSLGGRRDLVGTVTAREFDAETHTYVLDLLLQGYRTRGSIARERAPSAQVESWDGGTNTLTVTSDAFSSDSEDGQHFDEGDEVAIWSRDGVRQSTTYPFIDTISSATSITLDGDFGTYTPQGGDILRLAPSSTYFNDARYSSTSRPWTYLADGNDEVAHDGGTDDADVYGGGLGVVQ